MWPPAAADRQPALAITDLNNLFGAVKFYKAARDKGVKPVLGAEVTPLQGFTDETGAGDPDLNNLGAVKFAMPGALHQPTGRPCRAA
jgi:DNA polymerase III subunit alpha